jgi:hypothetical protein
MTDFKKFNDHGRRRMKLAQDCVQWLACSLAVKLLVLTEHKVCVLHVKIHCLKAHSKVPELTAMTKNGKEYSSLPLYATDALSPGSIQRVL